VHFRTKAQAFFFVSWHRQIPFPFNDLYDSLVLVCANTSPIVPALQIADFSHYCLVTCRAVFVVYDAD